MLRATLSAITMAKLKIPIYPRPVSPLSAEPLQSNFSDIYLDDSSSCSDGEQHTIKRRRIEKLGEQYLRGDGLLIMTAALRGPVSGWPNPWTKKDGLVARRARTIQHDMGEVPETVLRVRGRSNSATHVKPTDHTAVGGLVETSKGPANAQSWLKTVDNTKGHACSTRDDSPTPIRKNVKWQSPDHPTSKKAQHLRDRPQASSISSQLAAPISKSPVQDVTTPTLSSNTREDLRAEVHPSTRPRSSQSHESTAQPTTTASSVRRESHSTERPEPYATERPDPYATEPECHSTERPVAQTTNLGGERGLSDFDWKANRRSIHKVPPSMHLPEFEYRPLAHPNNGNSSLKSPDVAMKPAEMSIVKDPVADKGQLDLEKPAGGTIEYSDGSAFKSPPEMLNMDKTTESASRNMPPTAQSSSTTNTNAIPSAQVIPAVQPPLAESNSSTGKMIEPDVATNQQARTDCTLQVTDEPRTDILAKCPIVDGESTIIQRLWSGGGIVPFSAFKSPPPVELDTQEMLAAITPLGFSTVKRVWKSINKATPSTATRAKPQKRASLGSPPDAPSSLQGSIKVSLKVSKMVDDKTKTAESLNQQSEPLFGRVGIDMETSDEDEVAAEAEDLLELSSLLRGEPQQEAEPISSGLYHRACSAQEQDAQPQRGDLAINGRDGEEGQDDFNLLSAIDDLGSFLGTWDPDKEAKDIGSVRSGSHGKPVSK